jgi:DNA-binding beta-propeller fold protein YncE
LETSLWLILIAFCRSAHEFLVDQELHVCVIAMRATPAQNAAMVSAKALLLAGILALGASGIPAYASAPIEGERLPTGQRITPLAAPGATFESLDPRLADFPDFRAGGAVALALAPDGRTLLALTSGYNRNFGADGRLVREASSQYVFVYDIGNGGAPRKRQVLPVSNTFEGLAWDPAETGFYVSGGVGDEVHAFHTGAKGFEEDWAPVPLGHAQGVGPLTKPMAAGLAVSPVENFLLVANYQNDSVSLIDLTLRQVAVEIDLRPGKLDPKQSGVPGGEFPVAVAWPLPEKGYVASQRDRELVVLRVTAGEPGLEVTARIPLTGQPVALLASRNGNLLFVAEDNSDRVAIVDTATDALLAEFPVAAPPAMLAQMRGLKGANPNGLALSPDEQTLFVTLGGLNAVAVVQLDARAPAAAKSDDDDDDNNRVSSCTGFCPRVIGLIPTGWYPNAVALSRDGKRLFVVNGKSNAGPNIGACRDTLGAGGFPPPCRGRNAYVWQKEHAGLLSLPMPDGKTLSDLTWQVAANAGFPAARQHADAAQRMAFLRQHIRHVIYVLKENRSYDQVLGDLEVGNGDPRLVLFPEALSPNHHALARQFVTLDAFLDSGESSNTAWVWSTAGRTTDYTEKAAPITYSGRGLQYDFEGLNRNLNVGLPVEERSRVDPNMVADPDLLPGTVDVAAPDAPGDGADVQGAGYLWDAALRAHLTVRNYGFYGDFMIYDPKSPGAAPLLREPFAEHRAVYDSTKAALRPVSDPYYRSFDMRLPDFWRLREWQREFADFVAKDAVPNLMLVRLPGDHFGGFAEALDRVNTVETQMADNDYAVGALIETVAKSPVAGSTLIFVVEDDAQNGADHVDAHRSLALIAGPYVRRRAVVSTPYTTVSLLRTMEEALGLPPLGLNDGLADPMADVFDERAGAEWTYEATVPAILATTDLPVPKKHADAGAGEGARPSRIACTGAPPKDSFYWQHALGDQDYSREDQLDTAKFNAALWAGRATSGEAPAGGDGNDLKRGRAGLLSRWRHSRECQAH